MVSEAKEKGKMNMSMIDGYEISFDEEKSVPLDSPIIKMIQCRLYDLLYLDTAGQVFHYNNDIDKTVMIEKNCVDMQEYRIHDGKKYGLKHLVINES